MTNFHVKIENIFQFFQGKLGLQVLSIIYVEKQNKKFDVAHGYRWATEKKIHF